MRRRQKFSPLPSLEAPNKTPRDFDRELKRVFASDCLIGIDEAGRGPLAGPVFIAAVVLKEDNFPGSEEIRDSKKINPQKRKRLSLEIRRHAEKITVAWAYPTEIDRINILKATLFAMRRAAQKASKFKAAPVLIDGPFPIPDFKGEQKPIVKGDQKSLAIACASIIAKVYRDRWMEIINRRFPGYGFSRHKGYGTKEHLEALALLGASPVHRKTYSPVAQRISAKLSK